MWKPIALVACCAMAVTPFALANEGNSTPTPTNETSTACSASEYHESGAKQVLRQAWSRDRWQDRRPVRDSERRELEAHRACLDGDGKGDVARYAKRKKEHFALYRRYRQVAPFEGYRGRGVWLTYLAVPRYIVDCESGGSWFAYNPSGASWLYQLLGWGAPRPTSPEAKVRNHEIAYRVSGGSRNFSAWVCA